MEDLGTSQGEGGVLVDPGDGVVNSHTGRSDAFAMGNQYADDLATAACRDSFTNSANPQ